MRFRRALLGIALPLLGFIVYILAVHFVLDALPRYQFPALLLGWVFAGVVLARLRLPRGSQFVNVNVSSTTGVS